MHPPYYSHRRHQLVVAIALAALVMYAVHVFAFPLYDARRTAGAPGGGGGVDRRFGGPLLALERALCKTTPRPLRVPAAWREHCPRDGIVTVAQGGRLGNQIWEYASVWALARRTGLEAYVPRCISRSLGEAFERLTVPPLAYVGHCPSPTTPPVDALDAWNSTAQSILLPRYAALPELVLAWAADIRRELTFKASLRERARRVLGEAASAMPRAPEAYVGVHVRRTDYGGYLWRTRTVALAEPDYFRRAMEYFERKTDGPVLFAVVSDDPAWCERHLANGRPNVRVVSEAKPRGKKRRGSSAAEDLALMAACNHSIIDYGTFGVWGAILAGGETLLYNVSRHSSLRVGSLLPHWRVMA